MYRIVISIRLQKTISNANKINRKSSNLLKSMLSTLQIGLTGSIGMGKSAVSSHLKYLGFSVFDADDEVHKLYSTDGGAVEPISKVFPHVIKDNSISRPLLMEAIMNDTDALKTIEQIVHPLVISSRRQFYEKAVQHGEIMVFYDIPLLFENRAKYEVDYTIVVTASDETQKRRVLGRPGMTESKFISILSKQLPDVEKRQLADFIIHTDYEGYSESKAQIAAVIESIIHRQGERWLKWKCRNITKALQHPTADNEITRSFDLLLFDLDDTLVPTKKQLGQAYSAMSAYMEVHMPKSCEDMKAKYLDVAKEMKAAFPLIGHDLGELRRRTMMKIAAVHDEQQYVDNAMEVFITARNDIEENLYHDVLDCFRWATATGLQIGILTNGTADLSKCITLMPFISVYLTAMDLGVAKPSPVGFMASIHRSGFSPSRILYIGDSYTHDVLGAKNAGMKGALLLRDKSSVVDNAPVSPLLHVGSSGSVRSASPELDYSEADVILNDLTPAHIEEKILEYIRKQQ